MVASSQTSSPTACPRCGQRFGCHPEAIAACGCTRVQLTDAERAAIGHYVSTTFGRPACLCPDCLGELATQIRRAPTT